MCRKNKAGLLFVCIVILFAACRGRVYSPEFRREMRDAYRNSLELSKYLWTPGAFEDEKNNQIILSHLERLITDFHRIDDLSNRLEQEPGFKISLESQRQALGDVYSRFQEGSKDYARWKLRGVVSNCISCHARYNVSSSYLATNITELGSGRGFSERYDVGAFLIATRQFEKASEALFSLAIDVSKSEDHSFSILKVLKLWLIPELRALHKPHDAAARLTGLLWQSNITEYDKKIVQAWIDDLTRLAQEETEGSDSVVKAKKLIELNPAVTIENDELHLVTTLYATSLLHKFLDEHPTSDKRKEALYLLGWGYNRLPIQFFDHQKEAYLEQCIREFPYTDEARNAFAIYKDAVELANTGSGGFQLDPEQERKIQEFRELALGAKAS